MKQLGLMLALGLSFPFAVYADQYWGPAEQITNSSTWSQNSAEAAGPAGTLHMLTLDNRTGVPHVFYQRKPDGAQTWSSQVVLSLESVGAVQAGYHSGLATDQGQGVFAVWEEYYNGNASIYFRRSEDDGLSWGARTLVASPDTNTQNALAPKIALDSQGILHLVYISAAQGGEEGVLYYRKGSFDGQTLSTPLLLKGSAVSNPGLALGNGTMVAYFQENSGGYAQVKYMTSNNGGETWGNAQVLSSLTLQARQPDLVIDSANNIFSVWSEGTGDHGDTVIFRYCDHVTGLASRLVLSSSGGGALSSPVVIAQGTTLVAAWIYNNAGNFQMRMKTSCDLGVSWGADSGTNSGNAIQSAVLVNDRGNFHLFHDFVPSSNTINAYQVWHVLRDDLVPPAPLISSQTHPSGIPSGNNRPICTWVGTDNPGGIGLAGYAVAFDNLPSTDPGSSITNPPNLAQAEYPDILNGQHYLHVRGIDSNGNLGDVAHYAIAVDNNSFCPGDQAWVAPSPVRDGILNLRFFLTKASDLSVRFFDAAGRNICTQVPASMMGVNQMRMDISDWVNGTYFFRLIARAQDNGNVATITKPFVVLK